MEVKAADVSLLAYISGSLAFACANVPPSALDSLSPSAVHKFLKEGFTSDGPSSPLLSSPPLASPPLSSPLPSSPPLSTPLPSSPALYAFASGQSLILTTDISALPAQHLIAAYARMTPRLDPSLPWQCQLQLLPFARMWPDTSEEVSVDAGTTLLAALHEHFGSALQPVVGAALSSTALSSVRTAAGLDRLRTTQDITKSIASVAESLKSLSLSAQAPRLSLERPAGSSWPAELPPAFGATLLPEDSLAALAKDAQVCDYLSALLAKWSGQVKEVISACKKRVDKQRGVPTHDRDRSSVVSTDLDTSVQSMQWWDGMLAALQHANDFVDHSFMTNVKKVLLNGSHRVDWTRFDAEVMSPLQSALKLAACQCAVSSPAVRAIAPLAAANKGLETGQREVRLSSIHAACLDINKIVDLIKSTDWLHSHLQDADGDIHAGFAIDVLNACGEAIYQSTVRCTELLSFFTLEPSAVRSVVKHLEHIGTSFAGLSQAALYVFDFAKASGSSDHTLSIKIKRDPRPQHLLSLVHETLKLRDAFEFVATIARWMLGEGAGGGSPSALFAPESERVEQLLKGATTAFASLVSAASIQTSELLPAWIAEVPPAVWSTERDRYSAAIAKVETSLANLISDTMKELCTALSGSARFKDGHKAKAAAKRQLFFLWKYLRQWSSSTTLAAALRPRQAEHVKLLDDELTELDQQIGKGFAGSSAFKATHALSLPSTAALLQWTAHCRRAVLSIDGQLSAVSAFSRTADTVDTIAANVAKRCQELLFRLEPKRIFARWQNDMATEILPYLDSSSSPVLSKQYVLGRSLFALRLREITAAPVLAAERCLQGASFSAGMHKAWFLLPDFPVLLLQLMREFQVALLYQQHTYAGELNALADAAGTEDANFSGYLLVSEQLDDAGSKLRRRWPNISARVELLYPLFVALGQYVRQLDCIDGSEAELNTSLGSVPERVRTAWIRLYHASTAEARMCLIRHLQLAFSPIADGRTEISWLSDPRMIKDYSQKLAVVIEATKRATSSVARALQTVIHVPDRPGNNADIMLGLPVQLGPANVSAYAVAALNNAALLTAVDAMGEMKTLVTAVIVLKVTERHGRSCIVSEPPVPLLRQRLLAQARSSELSEAEYLSRATPQAQPCIPRQCRMIMAVEAAVGDVHKAMSRWGHLLHLAEVPDALILDFLRVGVAENSSVAMAPAATVSTSTRVHQFMEELSSAFNSVTEKTGTVECAHDRVHLVVDYQQVVQSLQRMLERRVKMVASNYASQATATCSRWCADVRADRIKLDAPISRLAADNFALLAHVLTTIRLKHQLYGSDTWIRTRDMSEVTATSMPDVLAGLAAAPNAGTRLMQHVRENTRLGEVLVIQAMCNYLRSTDVQLGNVLDNALAGAWQDFSRLSSVLEQRLKECSESQVMLVDAANAEFEYVTRAFNSLSSRWQDWHQSFSGDVASLDGVRTVTAFSEEVTLLVDRGTVLQDLVMALNQRHSSSGPGDSAMKALEDAHNRIISANITSKALGLQRAMHETAQGLQLLLEPVGELQQLLRVQLGQCDAKALRTRVDTLKAKLTNLPALVQSCAGIYDALVRQVVALRDFTPLLQEMKGQHVQRRHVESILRIFALDARPHMSASGNDPWSLFAVDVATLLSLNPTKHDKAIRDVIRVALGEAALDDYIRGIETCWESMDFEFATSRDGTPVIRGWDVIISTVEDHLASLTSMKLSPYFPHFEPVVLPWEARLLGMRNLCTVWVEVQRKWLYFEGLLASTSSTGSDIRQQLPLEASRFDHVHREVSSLLLKIRECPQVLASLFVQLGQAAVPSRMTAIELRSAAIGNLSTKLAVLVESLDKIQRGLSEYLETTRTAFPRLYFLGDDDCFELLGASANLPRTRDGAIVARHLQKMFAGICGVDVVPFNDGAAVIALRSFENEMLQLSEPVVLEPGVQLVAWLQSLLRSMRISLSASFSKLTDSLETYTGHDARTTWASDISKWICDNDLTFQSISLAFWWMWTAKVERTLSDGTRESTISVRLQPIQDACNQILLKLAASVTADSSAPSSVLSLRKIENMIIDALHKRDVTAQLQMGDIANVDDFEWSSRLRLYRDAHQAPIIRQAGAAFHHGLEYLGVGERLVMTPLTERCFLTLTQALHMQLGGSPFGPAGTGKTETVKALGSALGRLVLVFNCDDTFDFSSMGRILSGLVETGSWGCFDEFNRLEETVLSALSTNILEIQNSLMASKSHCRLLGREVLLHRDVGLFITMNPGYAGRTQLPDNLKALFRPCAMVRPDAKLIARVTLITQCFENADDLAARTTAVFAACSEQLSNQQQYDWGLRALKAVLVTAGQLLRSQHQDETQAVCRAIRQCIEPKLVPTDINTFETLVCAYFPDAYADALASSLLAVALRHVSADAGLFFGKNSDGSAAGAVNAEFPLLPTGIHAHQGIYHAAAQFVPGIEPVESSPWADKVFQLYTTACVRHGLMLVGPAMSGKSSCFSALLKSLHCVDGIDNVVHAMDPKASVQSMSPQGYKDHLYGKLDQQTLEWSDGILTSVLRSISAAETTERGKRHWIVFDGDVDPEWAENLNSVLDDNRLLTLPTGERIPLLPNTKIVFETHDLAHTTLATVSRCGLICFTDATVSLPMMWFSYVTGLASDRLSFTGNSVKQTQVVPFVNMITTTLQHKGLNLQSLLPTLIDQLLAVIEGMHGPAHQPIMPLSAKQVIASVQTMLGSALRSWSESSTWQNLETSEAVDRLLVCVLQAVFWSCAASCRHESRALLAENIVKMAADMWPSFTLPSWVTEPGKSFLGFDYHIVTNSAASWASQIPLIELEPRHVLDTAVMIPTEDTLRHTKQMQLWIDGGLPVILCGPPGSGKTMILTSILAAQLGSGSAGFSMVMIPFSSSTTPHVILDVLEQNCEYVQGPEGWILHPRQVHRPKRLLVFCDEINLPMPDKYGTQRAVAFLRQLIQSKGFWLPAHHRTVKSSSSVWVRLRDVQFVGACNPPSDPGRSEMSPRFLSLAPVLFIDYPNQTILSYIYSCLTTALCKLHASLRHMEKAIVDACIAVYCANKARFDITQAPQYVYSPRELSRWLRGIYECISPLASAAVSLQSHDVVRIWLHDGLRLFQDRCITLADKQWVASLMTSTARTCFSGICNAGELEKALRHPVVFSDWLSKHYVDSEVAALRSYASAKSRLFHEETGSAPIIIFDEALLHLLRISRVLRQPFGHLLLIGASGCGKSLLTQFAAWMHGIQLHAIHITPKYGLAEFDDDLRIVMKTAGAENRRVVLLIEEENIISSSFLERMNSLLATGEIPGLFEGDYLVDLLSECRENWSKVVGPAVGTIDLVDDAAVQGRFTHFVQRNLHVVFTMNPASPAFSQRRTTSPALFNRCVVNWMGDWSDSALAQVAVAATRDLDIDAFSTSEYAPPTSLRTSKADESRRIMSLLNVCSGWREDGGEDGSFAQVDAVTTLLCLVHNCVQELYASNGRMSGQSICTTVSPRDFVDLLRHFAGLYMQRRKQIEEKQTRLAIGVEQIKATEAAVAKMRISLNEKQRILTEKNAAAESKLNLMLREQNQAEIKRSAALQLSAKLEAQNEQIKVRQAQVERELSEAEPALQAAKQSVQAIGRREMDEVRALAAPPAPVKLTMEAVLAMLGHDVGTLDWAEVRRQLKGTDFISNILGFRTDLIQPKTRQLILDRYINGQSKEFNFERINSASRACGPLYSWVVSQVSYSSILERVGPLRAELDELSLTQGTLRVQLSELETNIKELEASIDRYKSEYADLIREAEAVRQQMETVQSKVERASSLVTSLSVERERWEQSSDVFMHQIQSMAGDCVLGAAYLAYAGGFDFAARKLMESEWRECATQLGVCTSQLSALDFLITPAQKLAWSSYGIPQDEVSLGNALLLSHFHRFPYIVDPSGAALEYIGALNTSGTQRKTVTKVSLLDVAYLKSLETACRFGTQLLLTDAERMSQLIFPVLNRDSASKDGGGRAMVLIGDHEVDLSPSFQLYLFSTDAAFKLPADISSRVTVVNFAVSQPSLSASLLTQVLAAVSPDLAHRRKMAIQNENDARHRLDDLEDKLLDQISNANISSGASILDDDRLLQSLEALKVQAASVQSELSAAHDTLQKLQQISSAYAPVSSIAAAVFGLTQQLSSLNALYQHELNLFLHSVGSALQSCSSRHNLSDVTDFVHVFKLGTAIIDVVADAFAVSMYEEHRNAWHLGIALKKLELCFHILHTAAGSKSALHLSLPELPTLLQPTPEPPTSMPFFLRGSLALGDKTATASMFTTEQAWALPNDEWQAILESHDIRLSSTAATETMPVAEAARTALSLIRQCIVIRHISAPCERSVLSSIMDCSALGVQRQEAALQTTLANVAMPGCTPGVLVYATPGADVLSQIYAAHMLASSSTKAIDIRSVSMGAGQSESEAETELLECSRSGTWLILRNVHLCPGWLHGTLKRLNANAPSARKGFRLILTVEVAADAAGSDIGTRLFAAAPSLRALPKIMVSAPPGIRDQVRRLLEAVSDDSLRAPSHPIFWRVVPLLAIMHAVVLERRRFIPHGWTKRYDFADVDFAAAVCILRNQLVSKGGSVVVATAISCLRDLVQHAIYGARVEHPVDAQVLQLICSKVIAEKAMLSGTPLLWHSIGAGTGVCTAEIPPFNFQSVLEWANSLPASVPAECLGLSPDVVIEYQSQQVYTLLKATREHLVDQGYHMDGRVGMMGPARQHDTADRKASTFSEGHRAIEEWRSGLAEAKLLSQPRVYASMSTLATVLQAQGNQLVDSIAALKEGAANAKRCQQRCQQRLTALESISASLSSILSGSPVIKVVLSDCISPRPLLTALHHSANAAHGGESITVRLLCDTNSADPEAGSAANPTAVSNPNPKPEERPTVLLTGARFSCTSVGSARLPCTPIFRLLDSEPSSDQVGTLIKIPLYSSRERTQLLSTVCIQLDEVLSSSLQQADALLAGLALFLPSSS